MADLVTTVTVLLAGGTLIGARFCPRSAGVIICCGVLAAQWILPDGRHGSWPELWPAPRTVAALLIALGVFIPKIARIVCFPRQEIGPPKARWLRLPVFDLALLLWLAWTVGCCLVRGWPTAGATVDITAPWLAGYVIGRLAVGPGPSNAAVLALMITATAAAPLACLEILTGHPIFLSLYYGMSPSPAGEGPVFLNHWGPTGHRPQLGGGSLNIAMRFATAAVIAAMLAGQANRQQKRVWLPITGLLALTAACSNVVTAGLTVLAAAPFAFMTGWMARKRPAAAATVALATIAAPAAYLILRFSGLLQSSLIAPRPHLNEGIGGYFNKTRSLWERLQQEDFILTNARMTGSSETSHGLRFIDGTWARLLADLGYIGFGLWLLALLVGGGAILCSARDGLRPRDGHLEQTSRQAVRAQTAAAVAAGWILAIYATQAIANPAAAVLPALVLGAAVTQCLKHRSVHDRPAI